MEPEVLESMLAEGCSLEEIGRRVGRHASTVSYWIEKHGLRAAHADRHAERGGLAREILEGLVAEGLTVREIAVRVDRSPTTVRYWLRFHGLETRRSARLRAGGRPPAPGTVVVEMVCATHGAARHVLRDGRYRCSRCNSDAVSRFRRNMKLRLVKQAGGACVLCGYSRCVAALQFHHLDPSTKRFNVSLKGVARAWDTVAEEAGKCVLLCANCHAEVESGVRTIGDRAA